ncbi:MAG: hypothetical protein P8J37_00680, partial [Fuerstiella sp.]|nr:hypothetical protein [Fuerstiella sp.]
MNSRHQIFLAAIVAFVPLAVPTSAAAPPDGDKLNRQFDSTVRPFLKKYCLDCHGNEQPEAKLDLSAYSTAQDVATNHQ